MDLSGKDLKGARLDGADLRSANLTGTDLTGANLTRTLMVDTVVYQTNFSNATLARLEVYGPSDRSKPLKFIDVSVTGADLQGAVFDNVLFESLHAEAADFRAVEFNDVEFVKPDFKRADFSQAILKNWEAEGFDLQGAVFESADLSGSNFKEANLKGVNFIGANLSLMLAEKANFEGAQLRGVDLRGATLTEADFTDANLINANISNIIADSSTWDGADLSISSGTDFNIAYSSMVGVNLDGVVWTRPDLSEADLTRASLVGAELLEPLLGSAILNGAIFDEAKLIKANLEESKLVRALGRKAEFIDTVFRKSDLRNARLAFSNFKRGRFEKANMERAYFKGSDFRGADLSDTNVIEVFWQDARYTRHTRLPFDQNEAKKRGMILSGAPLLEPISMFFNPRYIQTTEGSGSEGYTLREYFKQNSIPHTTFTEVDDRSWSALSEKSGILVFPELEVNALEPDLTPEALRTLRAMLDEGAYFIVMGTGRVSGLFNALFGWNLVVSNSTTPSDVIKANLGTGPLMKAENQLGGNDATYKAAMASLPANAKVFYKDSSDRVASFFVPIGEGGVYYFAYDWFNAAPKYTQDGNWLKWLGLVIEEIRK